MAKDTPRPSEIRELILAQHEELRAEYAALDSRVLRERCGGLYRMLLRHIAVEDTYLAPALRETDGFGPLRADDLEQEHDRQRRLLRYALSSIDETTAGATLTQSIPPLLESLRADMAHEERDLLDPDLLKDDSITTDTCTG
jgi:hypothetical protein